MAQPLPAASATVPFSPAAALPLLPSPSLTAFTSLPHLKQIHAYLLRNPASPKYQQSLSHLLLSAVSFPSYALSLLSFAPTHSPPSPLRSHKLLKQLSRSNNPDHTLLYFQNMQSKAFPVDRFCFPSLLKAASKMEALTEGNMIHGLALKLGYDSDPFVQTALMRMYAACGSITDARIVFDKMSHRDVVTWDIMIDGYCERGLFNNAFALLGELLGSNMQPDARILTTILSACSRARNLEIGKLMHEFISKNHIPIDPHLQSALLNMYASSGAMDTAQKLFDYLTPKTAVSSTAMICGYSRAGNIEAARLVFDQMAEKDLICWSAMISGYADSDKPQEALKIFEDMQKNGIEPDQVTMLSVISACARLGALDQARRMHLFVKEKGFGTQLPLNNALIDMYAKCGSLEEARQVFIRMHSKNIISWTSMVSCFATHGDAENALKYFEQMKCKKVEPNWVTFVGVLYACSHAGLIEEGERVFDSMVTEYGITPRLEHYGCMVDLYGRANYLKKALEIVENMSMAPNIVVWGSLMAACRIHGEFELGEFAARRVLELEPDHDGAHVFLSNIYAKKKNWEMVGVIRRGMKHEGILKEKGCSLIEKDGEMHEFLIVDRRHEKADQIYVKLEEVVARLRLAGYNPNSSVVVVDLDEDEKQQVVLWHGEKLALCYGLMGPEKKSCIHIIKNLRICDDCHQFMKLASKVYGVEIVIRDRSRFHHCRDGVCSCNDYW